MGKTHFCSFLGKLDSLSSVPFLHKSLFDSEVAVRCASAWSLGNLGSLSSAPFLHKSLFDSYEWVRQYSASSLGKIGSLSSVPFLHKSLFDSHEWVRSNSASSLGQIALSTAKKTNPELFSKLENAKKYLERDDGAKLEPERVGLLLYHIFTNKRVARECALDSQGKGWTYIGRLKKTTRKIPFEEFARAIIEDAEKRQEDKSGNGRI